jgi:hypothetical protein
MVLPRLKATIDRISGGEPKEIKVSDASYDEEDEKATQDLIELDKKQELWEVDVCSPVGFKWPRDDADMWLIADVEDKF